MVSASCASPFFSFCNSASILLLETNAISIPEKNADKSIDIKMPNTNNMSTCSVIIYFSASMVLTYFCAVELQLDAVPS